MVGLLVPVANLLLAPALVAGGTLLVLALEPLSPDPGADDDEARPRDADGPPEGEDDAG
jgi:hypothetical protein